jgi:hypothetical protein
VAFGWRNRLRHGHLPAPRSVVLTLAERATREIATT